MNYKKTTDTFQSSNGIDTITYYIYQPQNEPKAILQLSHGMCEYIARYEHFADFLTENNILLCGNDHLGHGDSVKSTERLGFFAKEKGWTFLAKDVNQLTDIMKDKYPNTPYFLMGHSMGSFIARDYLTKYSDKLNGALIVGTSGGNPFSKIAILLTNLVALFKGDMHRSKLIDKLAFGSYNNRYENVRTSSDWLTRDETIVDKYRNDEYCNFIFTTSGFRDLFRLLTFVSSKEWTSMIKTNLPIFILSGKDDPVGDYGKGVEKVYFKLKQRNVEDLKLKLYESGRHEIINETNKDIVYQDILNWICERV